MKIEKKTWSELFEKVKSGEKTFDLRLADFDCKLGDVLLLREWNPKTKSYTGREIDCEILFKLNTKNMEKFHTKEEIDKYGFAVLSIKKKS